MTEDTNASKTEQVLYLLHLSPPYKHAGHYLGITRYDRLAARLREHGHGTGSRLTSAACANGSTLILARLWRGADYEQERRRKHAGHLSDYCPICKGSLPEPECWTYPAVRAASRSRVGDQAPAWQPYPNTSQGKKPRAP